MNECLFSNLNVVTMTYSSLSLRVVGTDLAWMGPNLVIAVFVSKQRCGIVCLCNRVVKVRAAADAKTTNAQRSFQASEVPAGQS